MKKKPKPLKLETFLDRLIEELTGKEFMINRPSANALDLLLAIEKAIVTARERAK